MSKINSTIFKTITSSVDESRKTLALFNKDWNTYKTNWQNANGIDGKIGSIFASSNAGTSASVISNDQVQILRNWNNAVKHGCTDQATFNRIIANADENTKMYFAGLNKGKGSIEGLKNAQKVATQSTIGLTIAQTALNMAITMGITALLNDAPFWAGHSTLTSSVVLIACIYILLSFLFTCKHIITKPNRNMWILVCSVVFDVLSVNLSSRSCLYHINKD